MYLHSSKVTMHFFLFESQFYNPAIKRTEKITELSTHIYGQY